MKIGSFDSTIPTDIAAELSAQMSERVRTAHRVAEERPDEVETSTATQATGTGVDSGDGVGASLYAELEKIVAAVVTSEPSSPADLLGEVIDVVVTDRFERSNLPGDDELRQQVCEQMRGDPSVVAELDAILQAIACQLAIGNTS